MTNFKFYVQSKVGAVLGKDGLSYDTWSFDAKDQADADKKMAALVKKEGVDSSKVKKDVK